MNWGRPSPINYIDLLIVAVTKVVTIVLER